MFFLEKSIERFHCIGAHDVGVFGVEATGLAVWGNGLGITSFCGVFKDGETDGTGLGVGVIGVFGNCVSFIIMYKYKNNKMFFNPRY